MKLRWGCIGDPSLGYDLRGTTQAPMKVMWPSYLGSMK